MYIGKGTLIEGDLANFDQAIIWPENHGLVGRPIYPKNISEKIKIDRYGPKNGSNFANLEDVFESRSLPPMSKDMTLTKFEITDKLLSEMKNNTNVDYRIEIGKIAPAFGEVGGGTQYRIGIFEKIMKENEKIKNFTALRVDELIELGFLKEIK